jgi:hypothetical protein
VKESDIGEFNILDYVEIDKLFAEFVSEAAFLSQLRAFF